MDNAFVTVELPVAGGESTILHIDARLTTPTQQRAMSSLATALKATHAQTANGDHVDTAAQAIRWLLEQVAAATLEREQ